MKRGLKKTIVCMVALAGMLIAAHANAKPLKVYILAGQSNMQGMAEESTLQHLALSPESEALYHKLVDDTGKPRVHEKVSIAAFSQSGMWGGPWQDEEKHGSLTTGYGGGLESKLGTELAFGVTMQENIDEPILIIKTAWGGKSLINNFRPPSAGDLPVEPKKEESKNKKDDGRTPEQTALRAIQTAPGYYYHLMMKHIRTVLADPGTYCKSYDPKEGYEIAGFVWFQGFNDMIGAYPRIEGNKKNKDYSEYSRLLSCFIRDVRKELAVPAMPFVIGVMGIGGHPEKKDSFRDAMAAPAEMPEFKGNVIAVHTANYWDDALVVAAAKGKALAKIMKSAYSWTEEGVIGTGILCVSH